MSSLKASILLFSAALIWGLSFVFQSISADFIGPFTFNSLRFLVGALTLLPLILLTAKRKGLKNETLRVSLIGGLCCGFAISAASVVQQIGVAVSGAGKGGFLTALYIIIVPFLSLLMGRKLEKKVVLAAFLSVFGLYFLSVKEGFKIENGDIYLIICAFLFALHILIIDHFNSKGADGPIMAACQFFVASILTLPGMILEQPEGSAILSAIVPILYAGIMSCGVAYTLQIVGQKYVPPTRSSVLLSLESVFSALFGAIILSERLSPKELLGCVLVFTGVILAQLPSRKNHESTT
jgi:Predicted permease, DMT superfamily